MNLKDYQFLYNLLQEIIQKQLIERGMQVIGRWPIYELYNKSGYPIQQICQFFDVVLQHNKKLLLRMVNDARLNIHELKQELESIELISGTTETSLEDKALEELVIPEPEDSVVNKLLNTLFEHSTPIPEKQLEEEEEETILIPLPPPKEVDIKMTQEIDAQLRQLDAQFDVLQDKLFIHPMFMERVKDLPERIMKLFVEHGELTVKEVVAHLEIDASIRGVRIAFVVAWKQCAEQLIDAESLL